ncbi:hypothetical protein ACFQL1_23800 [Halomicroarcula sp. GCM10025709]|uniref:hypothetical protein n=1 Tax=Halomicroarcula sp. GCM10025709 TaxID=3252669 RepID=UPI00360C0216
MSRLPELGECITLADYDSDPWLLVTEVREESLRAVLCAELPPGTSDACERLRVTQQDDGSLSTHSARLTCRS